jgi:hypothetical protein
MVPGHRRLRTGVEQIGLQVVGFESVAGVQDALVLRDVLPLRLLVGDLLGSGELLRGDEVVGRAHADRLRNCGRILSA